MINNLVLQITAASTELAEQVVNVEEKSNSVSLLDLILKGGWVMIPLFILSVIAVYIFVERFLTIRSAAKKSGDFMTSVKSHVLKGDINGAKQLAQKVDTPISRMIEKGITRIGSPLKNIEAAIENTAKLEINELEKNLAALATIAGAGPMIGFFGTVIGMIQAFIAIAQEEGNVSPKLLSQGIYEAMITTAAGLVVGIIAYIAYNYLTAQIQKIIYDMEYNAVDFVDLLQEPQQ